jgi:hypothetical protein
MWFKKKLMPNLPVYNETGELLGVDAQRVPSVANEVANLLARQGLDFRNSTLVLSHLLGWFAFQIKQSGHDPEEFISNMMRQTLNYCQEFSRADQSGDKS